jgi:hypothetical protein
MIPILSTFFLAAAALTAAPPEIAGSWKAEFLGSTLDQPKIDNNIRFDLKAIGGKITGHVHMGNWPGDAPVIDGKVEGDRISFTLYGNTPWTSAYQGKPLASGLPKLTFAGTINGSRMELMVLWDSVMIYGAPPGPRQYPMQALRIGD